MAEKKTKTAKTSTTKADSGGDSTATTETKADGAGDSSASDDSSEKPDGGSSETGRGERQKVVSKAYRSNWNDIFGKKSRPARRK